jgi:hypothetical protein
MALRHPRSLQWALVLALAGCGDLPSVGADPRLHGLIELPVLAERGVDLLVVLDSAPSMRDHRERIVAQLDQLIVNLAAPWSPRGAMGTIPPGIDTLHFGVISADLGAAGVSGCDRAEGDDGLLAPPDGNSTTACEGNPGPLPAFLTFATRSAEAERFRETARCRLRRVSEGCSVSQPLEAAYRALVLHDAEARPGNHGPNAGFLRPEHSLVMVFVSNRDDRSVRDCRYREADDPDGDCGPMRGDARSVFDPSATGWLGHDLSARFTQPTPGSPQDPTWNLNRYIDPGNPSRGFLGLKPAGSGLVHFYAITGVPDPLPLRGQSRNIDWSALLGEPGRPETGFTGTTPNGPVSMRHGDRDPRCPERPMPACRRAPIPDDTRDVCAESAPQVALPAHRLAEVARRFTPQYDNTSLGSFCQDDQSPLFERIWQRVSYLWPGQQGCLRRLQTHPPTCIAPGNPADCVGPNDATPVSVGCLVYELLSPGLNPAQLCVAARGRRPAPPDPRTGFARCLVDQIPVVPATLPTPDAPPGFYYDTAPNPHAPLCRRIRFTRGAALLPGTSAMLSCRVDLTEP